MRKQWIPGPSLSLNFRVEGPGYEASIDSYQTLDYSWTWKTVDHRSLGNSQL